MIRLVFKFLILFIFFPCFSFSLEIPLEPQIKDISSIQKKENFLKVAVFTEDGKVLNGYIDFFKKKINIINMSQSKKNSKEYEIKNLKQVNFKSWNPVKRGKDGYLFFPSEIEFIFENNEKIVGKDLSGIFSKLRIKSGNVVFIRYCYFYDYYKNGKWINSKNNNFDFPKKNPLSAVVKKITFSKVSVLDKNEKIENVLKILQLLKKTGNK